MIFNHNNWTNHLNKFESWDTVFAWLPVSVSNDTTVWLEPVERRLVDGGWGQNFWEYRLPK